jgi:hypothetical protein
MTREVAVYMENMHNASSPGVRIYMDNDPQARKVEPAKGHPPTTRKTSGEKQPPVARDAAPKSPQSPPAKGVRNSSDVDEKMSSPLIDRRDSGDSAVVVRSVSGCPESVLSVRHSQLNSHGNDNEVSRSQVISSQSFPVTIRAEKYVFVLFMFTFVSRLSVVRLVNSVCARSLFRVRVTIF